MCFAFWLTYISFVYYLFFLPSNSGHGTALPIGQSLLLDSSGVPIYIPPVQSNTAYRYFGKRKSELTPNPVDASTWVHSPWSGLFYYYSNFNHSLWHMLPLVSASGLHGRFGPPCATASLSHNSNIIYLANFKPSRGVPSTVLSALTRSHFFLWEATHSFNIILIYLLHIYYISIWWLYSSLFIQNYLKFWT